MEVGNKVLIKKKYEKKPELFWRSEMDRNIGLQGVITDKTTLNTYQVNVEGRLWYYHRESLKRLGRWR